MPTQEELLQMYSKVTILQKIVTLQHIYSLFVAAQQAQPPRKDISFNIMQLQKMINNNPLLNPEFDFLDINGSLNLIRSKKQRGDNIKINILTPIQMVQVIAETLAIQGPNGKNEQVISQIPKTTVFRLSDKIDLVFVKDRLIKILNSYKNATLKEITALEKNYRSKKEEIQSIEDGKMDDTVLYKESYNDLGKNVKYIGEILSSGDKESLKQLTGEVQDKHIPVHIANNKHSIAEDNLEAKENDFERIIEDKEKNSVQLEQPTSKLPSVTAAAVPHKPKKIEKSFKKAGKHYLEELDKNESLQTAKKPKISGIAEDNFEKINKKVESKIPKPDSTESKNIEILDGLNSEGENLKESNEDIRELNAENQNLKVEESKREIQVAKLSSPIEIALQFVDRKIETEKIETEKIETEKIQAEKIGRNQVKRVALVKNDKLNEEGELVSPTPEATTPTIQQEKDFEKQEENNHNVDTTEGNDFHKDKRFQALSLQLISQISSNRFASMFLQPVNEHDEPQYYELVKHSVDLKTLTKKVRTGKIISFEELEFELQLMFSNAVMYNDIHQIEIYKGIIDMMEESEKLVNMFKENIS